VLEEDVRRRAFRRADLQAVAQQQALVAAPVAEQLDLGRDFRLTLDQPADRGIEAGGETARGEDGDFLGTHGREEHSSNFPATVASHQS
jgi:hypothetical protein